MNVSLNVDSQEMSNEIRRVVEKVLKESLADVLDTQTKVVYTRTELAEVFNVSVQSVDAHIISRPDFPRVYIGNRVVYPHIEVMQWIRRNTVQETLPDVITYKDLKKRKEA